MKILFTILLIGSVLSGFTQEQKVYFDDVISEHLRNYNKQCDLALKNNNQAYVDVLFDSLNRKHLKGTFISNLRLKRISGGFLETKNIKTPFVLITKKTCFVTHRDEIKAINELANQYKGRLVFIVLYWDRKGLVKKATKGYNRNVNIAYVNERDNKLDVSLSSIKNSFGAPTSFYITENQELNTIDRKFYLRNLKKSTKKEFYDKTYNHITTLLLDNEISLNKNRMTTHSNE